MSTPEPSAREGDVGDVKPLALSPRTHAMFERWAQCFCVYVFDVEQGQRLVLELPEGVLSPQDKQLVGYLAFPDSAPRHSIARAEGEDTSVFAFRYRHGSGVARGGSANPLLRSAKQQASGDGERVGLHVNSSAAPATGAFSYGVAFFRQQADPLRPRGCVQHSIVMVSRHGLVWLFSDLMAMLGPLFFRHGTAILESALHSMSEWPDLSRSSKQLELPCIGEVLNLWLPGNEVWHAGEADKLQRLIAEEEKVQTESAEAGASSPALVASRKEGHLLSEELDADNMSNGAADSDDRPQNTRCLRSKSCSMRCLGTGGRELVGDGDDDDEVTYDWDRDALASAAAACDWTTRLLEPQHPFASFGELIHSTWAIWETVLCGEPLVVFSPDFPSTVTEAVFAAVALIAPLEYAGDYRPYFTIYDGDFNYYKNQLQQHHVHHTAVVIGTTNPMVLRALAGYPTCLVLQGAPERVSKQPSNLISPHPGEVLFKNDAGSCLQRSATAQSYWRSSGSWFGSSKRAFVLKPDKAVLRYVTRPTRSYTEEEVRERDEHLRRHFYDLTLTFLSPLLRFIHAEDTQVPQTAPAAFNETRFLDDIQPVGVFAKIPRLRCRHLYARFIHGANFHPWLAKVRGPRKGGSR